MKKKVIKKLYHIITLIISQILIGQVCPTALITDSSGNENITLNCDYANGNEVCVDLKVDYPEILSTDEYEVNRIDYAPIGNYNSGTPIAAEMAQGKDILDDKFSKAIPLGFNFCFYDNTYSNIIIGANGILSFNLRYAETDSPTAVLVENPDKGLIDKAIFAIQQDLQFDLSTDSEIYYKTIGEAPCRKFIINYYNAQLYKCDEKSTIQIVLHEFTNEIDVHILKKPKGCDNGRNHNSLLGINRDGTKGISPPDKNTGIWEANKESWKFKPKGNKKPEIIWTNEEGEKISSNSTIKVCPIKNTTYTATVKYNYCNGNTFTLQDDFKIKIDEEFPSFKNKDFFVCDNGNDGTEEITLANYNQEISYNDSNLFTFKYYSDSNYLNPINTLNLNGNKTVYLDIINNKNPNCHLRSAINFNFNPNVIKDLNIQMCDNNNDGSESNVNLTSYAKNLLKDISHKSFKLYKTEDDANNQVNPIQKMDISSGSQFWIYVKLNDDCEKIYGPVKISLKKAPPVRKTKPIKFSTCDINFDHVEPFEWSTEIPKVMGINAGESFTVHKSYGDAVRRSDIQDEISDKFTKYYVRIQNSSGCYVIIEQPVEVIFSGVNVIAKDIYLCFDGEEDLDVNLSDYYSAMLIDPLQGVDISAYSDDDSAQNHVIENIIPTKQTITENGYYVTKTFYIRFQIAEDCYTVRQLNINLVHPISQAQHVLVCDLYNDTEEDNILSIYDTQILGDQRGTVEYFEDDSYTKKITSYRFTSTETTLYVEIKSHNCVERTPIVFKMTEVPPVEDITINIGSACDSDNNGVKELDLTSLTNKIYPKTNKATFIFYENFEPKTRSLQNKINDPTNFPITSTTTTFYVLVEANNYECGAVAKVELNTIEKSTFQIQDTQFSTCDEEGDLNETFYFDDIVDKIKQSLKDFDPSLYTIKFYETKKDAENKINEIVSDSYIPKAGIYNLYVRAQHLVSGCFDIKEVTLKTLAPPKPINGKISICDTNFNGKYDLNLNILPNIIMDEIDGFTFSYYLSEKDAIENNNKLDSNEIYEAAPFPNKIWVRVERSGLESCFGIQSVEISLNPNALNLQGKKFEINGCDYDNDGFAIFNLTTLEQEFQTEGYKYTYYESFKDIQNRTNEIQNPEAFQNSTANLKEVFVVVEKDEICPTYAKINLIYNTILVDVISDVKFCPSDNIDIIPEILDDAGKYNFTWKNEKDEIISNEPNLYAINEEQTLYLIVSNKNSPVCKKEFLVNVSHYDVPIITNVEIDENHNATITATGTRLIEYSINGTNWQSSNIFYNLPVATQTFWVRYKDQECIGLPWKGVILFVPNVITPNGDGKNDCVVIKDLEILGRGNPTTLIIYDRYGKEIFKKEDNNRIEWCGEYLGKTLNATDYWYRLIFPNGKEKRGHITVKNINFKK